MTMGKRIRFIVTAALAGALLCSAAPVSNAELSIEEIRQLLQESLTITEIDRELQRLTEEEGRVAEQIAATEREAARQAERMEGAKRHAARVLRSYYTGDRDRMWLLLLHADSFAEAMSVYQYLVSVVRADRHLLERYLASYMELKALQAELEERSRELSEIKSRFLAQRIRVVALQEQLDAKLAELDEKDSAAILERMDALSRAWYEEGLPLFRRFLQAMSDAMQELPDYIATYEDSLEVNGNTYTFRIRDEQLNPFLRSRNALFETFVFVISPDGIQIEGNQNGTGIAVRGHYAIESEPENALRFMIDELRYNGLELPDTTREDMQRQFQMTFYPKRYSSSLEATDVVHGSGELKISLHFSLGN